MTRPLILAIEGPPGAGKTTLLGALVPALADRGLFFPEPNIKTARSACPRTTSASETLWYLRQEKRRAFALRRADGTVQSTDPLATTQVVVCDRNHLGVLAYTWAARRSDGFPYDEAVAYYQRYIVPLYAETDLRTVILQVSVDTSLERRGGSPRHPRWWQWYDRGLLRRLADFYTDKAPALCPEPPLVIQTDPFTPETVLSLVTSELSTYGVVVPAAPPAVPLNSAVDDRFGEHHAALGGTATLGEPITAAFAYRGGLMQIFQLASLFRFDDRTRMWDPYQVLESDTADLLDHRLMGAPS
ncbi:AAA family ATPase [Actinomadura opuntiae]|uniref:AAA family ATPase n=1 Tax=Actinomadura sp. OS1-43 TaxID=604315 RepID=UPI00255AF687|nr:AAA family ATPase [Actinomadura sp. OS1-43]MDL4813070.1 AAA family ATPase [Actinomadura sp. OS1-43]